MPCNIRHKSVFFPASLIPCSARIWYNLRMKKKVLVALRMAGVAGQDKMAGIFRYLAEAHGGSGVWDMQLVRTGADFTAARIREAIAAGTDGFILSIPDVAEDALLPLAQTTAPMIVMDMHSAPLETRKANIAFIRNSGDEIGRAAATCLMRQGMARTYAFLHSDPIMDWSRARFASFRRTLNDCGLWCEELTSLDAAAKLKRPAAIFAANDDRAFELLRFLDSRRIRVPQDMAVLGVDNDTLICENAHPSLSSVQPDFEAEGRLAAKTLDAMMSGIRPDVRTFLVGMKEIAHRKSTSEPSHAGHLVQKAVAYINRHAVDGIGVEDVVAHIKCSRRLADLRFRQLQGRSIRQAIEDRRLDEVKRRLISTREKTDSIAAACGYESACYLRNLFRKRFSMTMTEFRRSAGCYPA